MKFMNIDHIYIIHCKPFIQRYEYLTNTFRKLNIPDDYYDFVVNTHKTNLTNETISKYYTTNETIRMMELKIIGEDKYLNPEISKGAISCGINHIMVWEKILNETSHKNILILEDDILFMENTINNLVEITMQIPKDYDIISLEDGAGLKVSNYITKNINPDKVLYKVQDGRMRCTGAYIINRKACAKLVKLNKQRKFSLEIDMQLWLYGKLHLLHIYWAEPNVFTQGSQRGVYKSEIKEDLHDNKPKNT